MSTSSTPRTGGSHTVRGLSHTEVAVIRHKANKITASGISLYQVGNETTFIDTTKQTV